MCDKVNGILQLVARDGNHNKIKNGNHQKLSHNCKQNKGLVKNALQSYVHKNTYINEGNINESFSQCIIDDKLEKSVFKYLHKNEKNTSLIYNNDIKIDGNQFRKHQNFKHNTNLYEGNTKDSNYSSKWDKPVYNFVRNYDKQQFLLAHCQFIILRENKLDSTFYTNPDLFIEWHIIQQLIIWTQEDPFCPICLSTPIPAKLTKCGHIFCWPCILHYLDLSEKYWRRCPICYESVKRDDLKSVKIKRVSKHKVGDMITMILMKRRKGSICIQNVIADELNLSAATYEKDLEMSDFAKIISVRKAYVYNEILEPDRENLLALSEDPDNISEIPYITEALEALQIKRNALGPINEHWLGDKNEFGNLDDTEIISTDSEDCYYFYQSIDGQPLYLNPINFKMLLRTKEDCNDSTNHNSFSNFKDGTYECKVNDNDNKCEKFDWTEWPPVLKDMMIVDMESRVQTLEFRKRFRFLSHLPLFKELKFVEVSFLDKTLKLEDSNIRETDLKYVTLSSWQRYLPALKSRARIKILTEQRNKLIEKRNLRKRDKHDASLFNQGEYILSDIADININSESDFPAALPNHPSPDDNESNIPSSSTSNSAWNRNNDINLDNQQLPHLSFSQLLKQSNDRNDWQDVSKIKYIPLLTPKCRKNYSLCSDEELDAQNNFEDPELSYYIWNSSNQAKRNMNKINLSDFICNEPKEERDLPKLEEIKKVNKKRNKYINLEL
ncbi:E3 ubiquitin-protein ligase RNF10-like isoform X2 [Gordionus sp. m RMFG-2023]|uniref:E3 ubiquitin-protein ligase RNF10-like isoform X2 n=1 Tax=Gordionus sp. m RMFG-2023 TaxID=3053472 RepID=UPI0031FD0E48